MDNDTFYNHIYTNNSWTSLLLLWILVLELSEATKSCHTMSVSGAVNHPDVDGLYDLSEFRCLDRVLYQKRPENGSGHDQELFIFYYRQDLLETGWLIGSKFCAADKLDAYLYVWNLNQRPDRGLLSWMEYDRIDVRWEYNRGFEVRCTEGLTYPAIVGIISGCLIAVFIIVLVRSVYYKRRRDKRQIQSSRISLAADSRMNGVHNMFEFTNNYVTEFNHDVTDLNHDVTDLNHDVTDLNHDVTELNHDITELSGPRYKPRDTDNNITCTSRDTDNITTEIMRASRDTERNTTSKSRDTGNNTTCISHEQYENAHISIIAGFHGGTRNEYLDTSESVYL